MLVPNHQALVKPSSRAKLQTRQQRQELVMLIVRVEKRPGELVMLVERLREQPVELVLMYGAEIKRIWRKEAMGKSPGLSAGVVWNGYGRVCGIVSGRL